MRKTISTSYLIADNEIRFQLGAYDRNETLVIDPVIQYSGTFGGGGDEGQAGIAVDSAGNAYVTGWTNSSVLTLVNPFQRNPSGSFVAKSTPLGMPWFTPLILAANKAQFPAEPQRLESPWTAQGALTWWERPPEPVFP